MNIHKNARLTPIGRERIARQIESGQTPEAAARAAGVCPRTARKWWARFKAEGVEGLRDRSSRPKRLNWPTPQPVVERVEALRRQRWTGQQIAAGAGVSPATVSRILKRLGQDSSSISLHLRSGGFRGYFAPPPIKSFLKSSKTSCAIGARLASISVEDVEAR